MSVDAAIDPTAAPADDPPGTQPPRIVPPLTEYERLAENLRKAIDDIVAEIPNFEPPHPSTQTFVRSHQNVPLRFVGTAMFAVTESANLEKTGVFSVDEAREALQFMDAFYSVYVKGLHFMQDLKFTIDSRRARVGMKALNLYAVAQRMARDPAMPEIPGIVRLMRDRLGKTKRKRTPPPAPATEESTPPA